MLIIDDASSDNSLSVAQGIGSSAIDASPSSLIQRTGVTSRHTIRELPGHRRTIFCCCLPTTCWSQARSNAQWQCNGRCRSRGSAYLRRRDRLARMTCPFQLSTSSTVSSGLDRIWCAKCARLEEIWFIPRLLLVEHAFRNPLAATELHYRIAEIWRCGCALPRGRCCENRCRASHL